MASHLILHRSVSVPLGPAVMRHMPRQPRFWQYVQKKSNTETGSNNIIVAGPPIAVWQSYIQRPQFANVLGVIYHNKEHLIIYLIIYINGSNFVQCCAWLHFHAVKLNVHANQWHGMLSYGCCVTVRQWVWEDAKPVVTITPVLRCVACLITSEIMCINNK